MSALPILATATAAGLDVSLFFYVFCVFYHCFLRVCSSVTFALTSWVNTLCQKGLKYIVLREKITVV